MKLDLPKVTSDRVCCWECGQRAPYLPNGLTDWHTNRAGGLCAAVFPPYVVARDPKTGARRPVARHGAPTRRALLREAARGRSSFVWDGRRARR